MADEKEKDLILGGEENQGESEDKGPSYIVTSYEERADLRSDIDTAMAVFDFMEKIDIEGPTVLNNYLTATLEKTQKNCLLIIAHSIELLMVEKDEENNKEEEEK